MTIQELFDELEVEYLEGGGHHHARPGWIQLDCPFCQTVGKYHMGYNLSNGHFSCWRCGGHHPIPTLGALGLKRADAEAFCDDRELSSGGVSARVRKGLKEPAGRIELLKPHRNYLESRGFDPDQLIRLWGIESFGHLGRFAWRIYIPIIHRDQRLSWTTRAIGEKVEQRYVSASAEEEAVNHKYLIYGLDYCLHSAIVVEGPTDVWRIGPGAGGLFGTAFSTPQVAKLARVPHRFICFDNAPTAQRRARALCEELSAFPGETQNIQIDAADPGSASDREVRLLRKVAKLK
jgi:hypothetical protein